MYSIIWFLAKPPGLCPITVLPSSSPASAKAVVEESSKLVECVGNTRSLLKKILSEGMDNCLTKLDNDPQGYLSQPLTLLEAVLQECHNTFTSCFHSFYPKPALQWACLCDLLNCLDQVGLRERELCGFSSKFVCSIPTWTA